jgi:pimeloyl-ACP methyl ester carboxylesterase
MATFVVCHGAWSGSWSWRKMRPLMRSAGHDFLLPTYTGLGERAHQSSPSIDLDTHIRDILAVLHYEDLRHVVLIGHSYGGMVATGVADRASERISRVVYLDAFVPKHGQSQFDLLPATVRAQRREAAASGGDGWLIPPSPSPADTPPEHAAWSGERRRWQPIGTFTQPITLGLKELPMPRTCIYCKITTPDDRFGPFAERARTEGWQYFEINAGHAPYVTAPEALMKILEQTH